MACNGIHAHKNSPDRGLRYLLTLTMTSDDLESYIVVNAKKPKHNGQWLPSSKLLVNHKCINIIHWWDAGGVICLG